MSSKSVILTLLTFMLILTPFSASSSEEGCDCSCSEAGCTPPGCDSGGCGSGMVLEFPEYGTLERHENGEGRDFWFWRESHPDSRGTMCGREWWSDMLADEGVGLEEYYSTFDAQTEFMFRGYEFNDENIAFIQGVLSISQNHCNLKKFSPIFNSSAAGMPSDIPKEIMINVDNLREDGSFRGVVIDEIYGGFP